MNFGNFGDLDLTSFVCLSKSHHVNFVKFAVCSWEGPSANQQAAMAPGVSENVRVIVRIRPLTQREVGSALPRPSFTIFRDHFRNLEVSRFKGPQSICGWRRGGVSVDLPPPAQIDRGDEEMIRLVTDTSLQVTPRCPPLLFAGIPGWRSCSPLLGIRDRSRGPRTFSFQRHIPLIPEAHAQSFRPPPGVRPVVDAGRAPHVSAGVPVRGVLRALVSAGPAFRREWSQDAARPHP